MFDNIVILLVAGALIEAIWETLKMVFQNGKLSWDRIGALAIGILLAVGAQLDILELVGIVMVVPYVGMILTGVIISRGANFIHDLLKRIEPFERGTITKT